MTTNSNIIMDKRKKENVRTENFIQDNRDKKNAESKETSVAFASKKYRELTDIYLNGISANAVVLKIEDTGFLFNYNPVAAITLRVISPTGMEFETSGETLVSQILFPSEGDKIQIKFDPDNISQFVIL